ncbi:MAG: flagellar hook assembly protein FlgD [Pseudomonadales bacterium]|nr:flagellar hook assembly protein FlgD [Pseudomonadales bacterium]
MASVTGVNNQNSVLSDLSISNQSTDVEETQQDMFMRLMLAQLENQNPLNPQDGTEFVSQLAQFSTLEGIGNINSSIEEIGGMYRSSQALQATALVGRDVLLDSNEAYYDSVNSVTGVIKASGETALDAKVTITDASGQVVRTENLGNLDGDEDTPFAWDGADDEGNALPPGKYQIAVNGRIGNEMEALDVDVHARVTSVSIVNNQGDMVLNLNGLGQVSSTDVKEIR